MNAERRVTIAHLEQKVSDGGVEKELVSELREQIDCLEEQLGKLQTQVHDMFCVVLSVVKLINEMLVRIQKHSWTPVIPVMLRHTSVCIEPSRKSFFFVTSTYTVHTCQCSKTFHSVTNTYMYM